MRTTGSSIAKDVIASFTDEKEARLLLDKGFITPKIHGAIMVNNQMYRDSYQMLNLLISKVSSYQLFQVIDKGLDKTMRYKLTCKKEDMKFVELVIDVNPNYNLANYYLYLTSQDRQLKHQNDLSVLMK